MRSKLLLVSFAPLAAALLVLAACGGDDDQDIATPTPSPADDGPGVATFAVEMFDNFFQPASFSLEPGQQAVFNLVNEGEDIHNMQILLDDNPTSVPQVIAAGESGVLEWTAPSEPGVYDFHCEFHPGEMVGTITVE